MEGGFELDRAVAVAEFYAELKEYPETPVEDDEQSRYKNYGQTEEVKELFYEPSPILVESKLIEHSEYLFELLYDDKPPMSEKDEESLLRALEVADFYLENI